MKKIAFTLIFTLVCLLSHAQFYVGGTFGLGVQNINEDEYSSLSTTFSLSPEIGYKFNPVWSVGTSLNVAYLGDYELTSFSINPYVRGIFAKTGCVKYFGELDLGFGALDGSFIFNFNLKPGILIDLSPKIQLVGRSTLFNLTNYELGDWSYGFYLNNSLELGIIFNL